MAQEHPTNLLLNCLRLLFLPLLAPNPPMSLPGLTTPGKERMTFAPGLFYFANLIVSSHKHFHFRCLSTRHKHWDCPSIRDLCTVCRDNNLGDLAYGHIRFEFSLFPVTANYFPLESFILRGTNGGVSTSRMYLTVCVSHLNGRLEGKGSRTEIVPFI